ncbi:MAG TPA: hypothetical protein PK833_01375, partial [Vicingus sp.]|nr:hypothetical protein [Vicingus sp.]
FTNGLLNICQAIEMFYNQDMGVDFKKTREKFNNTKQQALDKIKKKKDEIGLTDNEMEFFNVPFKVPKENGWMPFQHKLLHQLNEVKIAINGFINQNEFNDFATKLKDCRDDLTHVNHNNDISNTYDLPYLFYHSQILFYAIITNKIGIEQIKINQIMKSSDKFERYFKEDDKNKPLKKHDHKKGD